MSFGDAIAKMLTGKGFQSAALTQLSKASFGTDDWGDAVEQLEDEIVSTVVTGAVSAGTKALIVPATSAFGPIGAALTTIDNRCGRSTIYKIGREQDKKYVYAPRRVGLH